MNGQIGYLLVYERCPAKSLDDFIDFWSNRYYDGNEILYTDHIHSRHTAAALRELFHWKIGDMLFTSNLPPVNECFIDRRDEAQKFLKRLAKQQPREIARRFLERFDKGGAIWRIFWLHCCDTRFPIYDQHVHRAMTCIKNSGQCGELGKFNDEKKVESYLGRYLPFFYEFPAMANRKVDKALWVLGKSLKNGALPRLRS